MKSSDAAGVCAAARKAIGRGALVFPLRASIGRARYAAAGLLRRSGLFPAWRANACGVVSARCCAATPRATSERTAATFSTAYGRSAKRQGASARPHYRPPRPPSLICLEKLCDAYVADLRRRGKETAAHEAEGIFRRHVTAAAGAMPALTLAQRDSPGRSSVTDRSGGRDARPASFAVTYALRIKRRSLVIRRRSRNSSLTQTQ